MNADRVTWIFFDLGSTLLDESEAHRARFEVVARLLARRKLELSADELWRMCERASAERAPSPLLAALSRLGLPSDALAELRTAARYEHAHERLYPGVPELLAKLSASFELGLIANQSAGTAERLVEHGITRDFAVVASSAEIGMSKPDPAIFRWALERARCSAEEAVMIGDRLDNDIAPAKALGMRAVRVLQGFARAQRPRSSEEAPDRTIDTIAEVGDALVPAELRALPAIREGSARDGAAVAAVFGAAWAALRFVPKLHTREEDLAFFSQQLDAGKSFVAESAGTIVGFAIYGPGRLHHIYVHPEHQARGLGSELLARVQASLPGGFDLWTFQPNTAARRFYERHGLSCVEETDGSANEERVPDARYVWLGRDRR